MRRIPVVLVLLSAAGIAPAPATSHVVETEAMVPMPDGVRLHASLYLPAAVQDGAELPLVVRQHGGGSHKDNEYDVKYGLAHVETGDFALLMYSHRGHGSSEGEFDFFGTLTTQDFSHVVDWVEATAGSKVNTSNVGVTGYSQGGGESLLPAAFDARVKAAAVGQTFADLNHALNPNDCFKFSFATGIFAAAYKVPGARTRDDLAIRWGLSFYTDTEDDGDPSTTGELHERSPQTYLQALIDRRVPVFWTQAWEDQLFPGDHPERILEPLDDAGVPVHYWFSSGGHSVGPNFPAEETAREQAMLEWLDEFLRGTDHEYGSGQRPEVDYWRRTAPGKPGEWVPSTASDWPVPEAEPMRLYLHAGGELAGDPGPSAFPGTNLVNDVASANLANDPIVSEIDNNARARGTTAIGDVAAKVPESVNPVDSATWTSDPLVSPVSMVGAPRPNVWATVSGGAPEAMLAFKVWDVAPDGTAALVSRGCGTHEDTSVNPRTFSKPLWPNAHRFDAGHRIAFTASATDFPTFKPESSPYRLDLADGISWVELPVL